MVSMSNTALQRLHDLGGTVTSEEITLGDGGSWSKNMKVKNCDLEAALGSVLHFQFLENIFDTDTGSCLPVSFRTRTSVQ